MITYQEALEIIQSHLKDSEENMNKYPDSSNLHIVLLNAQTIEKDYGWVFFYDSKEYIETGNISYGLAGNAPVIVEKKSGKIIVTGTAHQIEYYLNIYEERGNLDGII